MFNGKVVIVTGSSTGIGAQIAIRFAKEGASGLTIHGRNEAALKERKNDVEEASGGKTKVHVVVGDITSDEVRKNLIEETIQTFGQLDILVNNAGYWDARGFFNTPLDGYDKMFNVKVRSTIGLCQIAAPHLIKSKGNIVNMSSEYGITPQTEAMFFACADACINHFTKCLALELGPKGVRVNAVNPGYIPYTNALYRLGVNKEEENSYVNLVSKNYPLRRPGTKNEVADAVLFLASDKATFITGTLLPVDGGCTIAGFVLDSSAL